MWDSLPLMIIIVMFVYFNGKMVHVIDIPWINLFVWRSSSAVPRATQVIWKCAYVDGDTEIQIWKYYGPTKLLKRYVYLLLAAILFHGSVCIFVSIVTGLLTGIIMTCRLFSTMRPIQCWLISKCDCLEMLCSDLPIPAFSGTDELVWWTCFARYWWRGHEASVGRGSRKMVHR